eukprot:TRINITY_DN28835_c0_g1_i4.p6 TRINITY_DN28835_c0_g1~~TRINITY_DN28835_c0_g1_i4.p6  ORF type:complete len:147 (+),score=3.15 TRINITY_DN28835_c0_g1_i4:1020-1460(+)
MQKLKNIFSTPHMITTIFYAHLYFTFKGPDIQGVLEALKTQNVFVQDLKHKTVRNRFAALHNVDIFVFQGGAYAQKYATNLCYKILFLCFRQKRKHNLWVQVNRKKKPTIPPKKVFVDTEQTILSPTIPKSDALKLIKFTSKNQIS